MHGEGMYVDVAAQELRYNDGNEAVPLSDFGGIFDDVDFVLDLEYTITSSFRKTNGKVNIIFGNSGIINCNYVFPMFLTAIQDEIESQDLLTPA